MYPKGVENDEDTFMSVFLHNETDSEFRARFQFSILDINNKVLQEITQAVFNDNLKLHF